MTKMSEFPIYGVKEKRSKRAQLKRFAQNTAKAFGAFSLFLGATALYIFGAINLVIAIAAVLGLNAGFALATMAFVLYLSIIAAGCIAL